MTYENIHFIVAHFRIGQYLIAMITFLCHFEIQRPILEPFISSLTSLEFAFAKFLIFLPKKAQ